MNSPQRILIIRLSSLGDILHALPAYQSLRCSYPQARIDWLVAKRMAFLLSAVEGIDAIVPIDTAAVKARAGSAASWRAVWTVIRELRAARYDLSVDFQGLLKTAILGVLCGAHTRVGFSRGLVREWPAHWFYHRSARRPEKPLHVVELNQLLAAQAGAVATAQPVSLSAPAEDKSAIESMISSRGLEDFVVINPGGGWPTKLWPPSRYGALAAMIEQDLKLQVVVTSGPGEEALFEEIALNCPGRRLHHFQVPFLQLIPLFKKTRLVIGGDTGPVHLACALGTPVVGIFGPTDPVRNGPWAAMDARVVHVLPCSFCYGRTCPTQNECMDIGVDEVFRAVVARLSGPR